MAYARPNQTSRAPFPPARRPKRAIVISGPQNPAATLAEATGTWNFAFRVWIAFDPPTAATPTWIDISGFVEQDSTLTINHGRADGLSDATASTCSLTVDNSDGRFSAANPAGAWFGQVHKGNWLKIEIFPPSGVVSSRFVGFITSLPNQWSGQYQTGQVTASDRFEKLGQAPALISMIENEVLSDPNLAPGNFTGSAVKACWNLHEASGALTFGDTSGQGARHLLAVGAGGVPAGIGFGASNVNAPGFDGLRAVTFNPVTATQGTYLTAPISYPPAGTWAFAGTYTGLAPTMEFWFQATTTGANQMLACFFDPVASFAYSLYIDGTTGLITYAGMNTSLRTAWLVFGPTTVDIRRVDDGKWHHVIWSAAVEHRNSDNLELSQTILYLDGILAQGVHGGIYLNNGGPNTPPLSGGNFAQLFVGGGYDPNNPGALILGAANISDFSYYWADASYANANIPNCIDHYAAGATGFLGESTDTRIARLARYGSVPVPTHSIAAPMSGASTFGMSITVYNPTQGPWTNLSAGAHLVGTQNVAGRKALDAMQEAAHTEGMPLYVDRSGFLSIQNSTIRQNTTPAWSVNALELDPSTAVADDFAYTTNQMTVTPNGQAAQTVIGLPGSAGRLSQAKYGIYDGSQATASVTPVEAQSLGLGVIQLRADPAPRLAPFAVEVATAALLPGYGASWYDAVLATEISTPIRVTNAPAAVGGGNYDCLVEGWSETISAGNHLLSFNTSPIQGPTYQLDDVVLGHLDTDGTTLAVGINTSVTTFTAAVTSATSAAWTTNTADFPFDILMDTERMTVTSIAPVALGVDGTFETGASGWTLSNCTLAQSSAQAHTGTHSGLVTATAGGNFSITTPQFAVNGGATYQPNYWYLFGSGTPQSYLVTVSWFTSGGGLISSVSPSVPSNPMATWQQAAAVLSPPSVTAPANAAFATVQILMVASVGGNSVYADDVVFTLLTGGQQQMTVTRSVNGVVASHSTGAALSLYSPLTLAY